MKLILIFLMMLSLFACASNGVTVVNEDGEKTVAIKLSGKQYARIKQEESDRLADAEISKNNSECWQAYFESQNAQRLNLPAGATTEQIMIIGLMEQQKETIKGLLAQNSNVRPCPLATNSNDVGIAYQQEKTKRIESANRATSSIIGSVAKTSLVGLGISKGAGVLNRAFSSAGDKTTISDSTIEGSGIGKDNTIQDRGSVIVSNSKTGNTATNGQKSGKDEEKIKVVDEATCVKVGGDWREATEEEIESNVDIDGFVCSDGNGGILN